MKLHPLGRFLLSHLFPECLGLVSQENRCNVREAQLLEASSLPALAQKIREFLDECRRDALQMVQSQEQVIAYYRRLGEMGQRV